MNECMYTERGFSSSEGGGFVEYIIILKLGWNLIIQKGEAVMHSLKGSINLCWRR